MNATQHTINLNGHIYTKTQIHTHTQNTHNTHNTSTHNINTHTIYTHTIHITYTTITPTILNTHTHITNKQQPEQDRDKDQYKILGLNRIPLFIN